MRNGKAVGRRFDALARPLAPRPHPATPHGSQLRRGCGPRSPGAWAGSPRGGPEASAPLARPSAAACCRESASARHARPTRTGRARRCDARAARTTARSCHLQPGPTLLARPAAGREAGGPGRIGSNADTRGGLSAGPARRAGLLSGQPRCPGPAGPVMTRILGRKIRPGRQSRGPHKSPVRRAEPGRCAAARRRSHSPRMTRLGCGIVT